MKVLQRIFIIGVLIFLISVGAFVCAANNAGLMSHVLCWVMNTVQHEIVIERISLGEARYKLPSTLHISDARLDAVVNGKPLALLIAHMDVRQVASMITGKPSRLEMRGADISYDLLKVNGLAATVVLSRPEGRIMYEGDISVADCAWDKLQSSAVRMSFKGNAALLKFDNGSARFYNGDLVTRGRVILGVPVRYDILTGLQGVDAVEFERMLGCAAHNFVGKLSGRIRVRGAGEQLNVFDAALNMPSGGEVSAGILASIASYLPSSIQQKRLRLLVQSGGRLAVEVFSVTIRKDSPDHLSGKIRLKSREANMELNVSHEVRVDVRIDALLEAWSSWQDMLKPSRNLKRTDRR